MTRDTVYAQLEEVIKERDALKVKLDSMKKPSWWAGNKYWIVADTSIFNIVFYAFIGLIILVR